MCDRQIDLDTLRQATVCCTFCYPTFVSPDNNRKRLDKKNTQKLLDSLLYFYSNVWLGDFGPETLSVAKYRFPKSKKEDVKKFM